MPLTLKAFQADAFQNDAFQIGVAAAAYNLEVMWDGTNWTDETANVISRKWRRGRDRASQLTGRGVAGVFEARLQNPAGRYASFNTSSPLYGNIVPGRAVRLRNGGGSTFWQGFLAEIVPTRGRRGDLATMVLRAVGPLKFVADRDTTLGVQLNITTGAAIAKVLDDAGWPAASRTLDAGQVTMARWKPGSADALTALRELEETEFGYVGESKDGKIVFEDVNHRLLSPHATSQATFTDASGGALPYDGIEQLDPWREIFNRFSAQVITYTVQTLATLWSLTGETPSIDAGASRDFWAVYPTPDAAKQADHVDAWTTPVATTDVLANGAADGSGTNLTGSIGITVSKFANAMKITLTNNAAVLAYITLLQARGTPAYANDPVEIVSEDTTSQGKYGIRAYPLPGKFYSTTDRAKNFTDYAKGRYAGPVPVLTLAYQADSDDAHLEQALARDISDRITIVANGTLESGAQLGINRDFYIESEEHSVDLGGHWVTYQLSDASADGGWWRLDFSQLDIDTRLAV